MKKKRFPGILLSLALMLGMMPALGISMPAYADDPVSYNLWVGGTQVTSANAGNIDGNNKASYDASSNTLTLKNYEYSGNGVSTFYNQGNASIFYTQNSPLIVELIGENKLNVPSTNRDYNYGISNSSGPYNITFTGNGSLNIVCNKPKVRSCCISSTGNVVIEGPNLYLEACNTSSDDGIFCSSGMGVSIVRGSLTAKGGDRAVTGTVKNAIDGTGWTDTAGTTGKRIIKAVTGDETSDVSAFKMVQFPVVYPFWVGGTQVTSANKDDVLDDGKVSYTPSEDGKSGTLTLTNATINTAMAHGDGTENIYSEDIDLKIVLNGNNTISTEGEPAKWAIRADDNTDDGQDFGNLTIGGNGSLTVNGADVALYSKGSIEIKGGRISATSKEEETIYVKNNVTISGGEVTANSRIDDAIYVWNGNVSINGGTVNVTGGSRGIYAKDSVTLNGGTVNATGRSVGIYAHSSVTVNGGTIEATGEGWEFEPQSVSAAASRASGISAPTIEIKNGINSLTATGKDMAIYGSVKNEIAGTGWTNTAGTDGKADIAINTEGQTLDYKKVQFPKVAPAPAPSTATPILAAKGIASGKKAVKISWNGVSGAAKYEVYLNKCNAKGKKYKAKLKGSTTGNTMKIKKLKNGRCYKFYIVAKDSKGNVISQSMTGHFIAGNVKGKRTNAKSLTLGASSATLSKGATFKITAKQKKAKKGKKLLNSGHAPLLRYVSDNPSVATVDANGVVTAAGAGSCNVYVFTVNGIWQTVTVNVN